jgi:hypothetical protein
LGQELLLDDSLAHFRQRFEPLLPLLARGRVERVALGAKAQPRAVKGQVHIFREPLDDPEHLGE